MGKRVGRSEEGKGECAVRGKGFGDSREGVVGVYGDEQRGMWR